MKNVALDRTTVLQLDANGTDGALDAPADCHVLRNDVALNLCAIVDQEIRGAQLAFDSPEDLHWTIAFDVADDRHVRADTRGRSRFCRRLLPPRRGGGAQVRTSFENRTAQAICRRAANRGRWTVTGPGSGSVCLFSVALSRRRSTTNLLDSQAAATILQAKSSRPL